MGSPEGEDSRHPWEIPHEVTLTNGFYLGKYEVTQEQYEAVINFSTSTLNPKPSAQNNPKYPVEQVTYNDVQEFIQILNDQSQDSSDGNWHFDLPTEAEWEYACRAGTQTRFHWGDTMTTGNANHSNSGPGRPMEVGQWSPNNWGFYDMHGNVQEWVKGWWYDYTSEPVTDPMGPTSGTNRVLRGGAFFNGGFDLRSAERNNNKRSNETNNAIGFRLVYRRQ